MRFSHTVAVLALATILHLSSGADSRASYTISLTTPDEGGVYTRGSQFNPSGSYTKGLLDYSPSFVGIQISDANDQIVLDDFCTPTTGYTSGTYAYGLWTVPGTGKAGYWSCVAWLEDGSHGYLGGTYTGVEVDFKVTNG
jgi:hypothetical protein